MSSDKEAQFLLPDGIPDDITFKIGDGRTQIWDERENPFKDFEETLEQLNIAGKIIGDAIIAAFAIPSRYFDSEDLKKIQILEDPKEEARKRSREDLNRKRKELRKRR